MYNTLDIHKFISIPRCYMNCIQCNKDTANPKFCSRSCSVSYNNKISPKRERLSKNPCKVCGKLTIRNARGFCSHTCYSNYRWNITLQRIESTGYIHSNTNFHSSPTAKKYISEKYGYVCSLCQLSEWQNKPIVLILDHINGKPNDWSISNLRLVCPNCDSQLPTYKAKNTGNGGRPSRRIS